MGMLLHYKKTCDTNFDSTLLTLNLECDKIDWRRAKKKYTETVEKTYVNVSTLNSKTLKYIHLNIHKNS